MTTLASDDIQTNSDPINGPFFFCFNQCTQHPIDSPVTPSDANGANMSRVANPSASGYGASLTYAVRHYADMTAVDGARAQMGTSTSQPTAFGTAVLNSPYEVYVAHLMYFPSALSGDAWCNIWDFHSTDAANNDRWDTRPGHLLDPSGTMKIYYAWHDSLNNPDPTLPPDSSLSSAALPVGEWFWLETYYKWVTSAAPFTISTRLNGTEILSQSSVYTRPAAYDGGRAEMYAKLYGQGTSVAWTPEPSIKYTGAVEFNDGWRSFGTSHKGGSIFFI